MTLLSGGKTVRQRKGLACSEGPESRGLSADTGIRFLETRDSLRLHKHENQL